MESSIRGFREAKRVEALPLLYLKGFHPPRYKSIRSDNSEYYDLHVANCPPACHNNRLP